jgi:hypothetical protein
VERADVPAAKIVWAVAAVHPGPFDVDETDDSVEVYYRNAFGCLFSNGREIPKSLPDLFMFRRHVIHQHIIGRFLAALAHKAVERGADCAMRALPEFWSYKEPAWRGLKAAAKSEALSARTTADKNPKS